MGMIVSGQCAVAVCRARCPCGGTAGRESSMSTPICASPANGPRPMQALCFGLRGMRQLPPPQGSPVGTRANALPPPLEAPLTHAPPTTDRATRLARPSLAARLIVERRRLFGKLQRSAPHFLLALLGSAGADLWRRLMTVDLEHLRAALPDKLAALPAPRDGPREYLVAACPGHWLALLRLFLRRAAAGPGNAPNLAFPLGTRWPCTRLQYHHPPTGPRQCSATTAAGTVRTRPPSPPTPSPLRPPLRPRHLPRRRHWRPPCHRLCRPASARSRGVVPMVSPVESPPAWP